MNAMVPDRVERSFSRSFHSYHDAAGPQAGIAAQLAARLGELGAPDAFETLFEIGCGTGHLTAALQARFDISSATLNDLMPQAVETARAWNAEFLAGDIRAVDWPRHPDLIASTSTIQWLDDPREMVQRAARALAPGGWLAISGFGRDQFAELRDLGSESAAPGLCAPEDLAEALEHGGGDAVEVLDLWQERHRLWFRSPPDVLRHLRETGVNGRAGHVWTRATLAAFCDGYTRAFATDKGVPLTYHPIWIIARRRA